jgi:hypothetical protein
MRLEVNGSPSLGSSAPRAKGGEHDPYVEWQGEPFALLVQSEEDGDYLVPPVLLDSEERLITREGREVADAVVLSAQTVELPVDRWAGRRVAAEKRGSPSPAGGGRSSRLGRGISRSAFEVGGKGPLAPPQHRAR